MTFQRIQTASPARAQHGATGTNTVLDSALQNDLQWAWRKIEFLGLQLLAGIAAIILRGSAQIVAAEFLSPIT
jgi:hypothetical protein